MTSILESPSVLRSVDCKSQMLSIYPNVNQWVLFDWGVLPGVVYSKTQFKIFFIRELIWLKKFGNEAMLLNLFRSRHQLTEYCTKQNTIQLIISKFFQID